MKRVFIIISILPIYVSAMQIYPQAMQKDPRKLQEFFEKKTKEFEKNPNLPSLVSTIEEQEQTVKKFPEDKGLQSAFQHYKNINARNMLNAFDTGMLPDKLYGQYSKWIFANYPEAESAKELESYLKQRIEHLKNRKNKPYLVPIYDPVGYVMHLKRKLNSIPSNNPDFNNLSDLFYDFDDLNRAQLRYLQSYPEWFKNQGLSPKEEILYHAYAYDTVSPQEFDKMLDDLGIKH